MSLLIEQWFPVGYCILCLNTCFHIKKKHTHTLVKKKKKCRHLSLPELGESLNGQRTLFET